MSAPTDDGRETVVVVGATGAFGTAIVDRLVAHGYEVLAIGRDGARLEAVAAAQPASAVRTCVADVTDDAAVGTISGALDDDVVVRAVVHGPGLSAPGDVLSIEPASLVGAVDAKVGGMLRVTRAVDSHLRVRSRLIAIAGHYGLEPSAYAAAAGVANAALVAVMRQLSLAYGPRGVTAHTIAPGPADTPRLRSVVAGRAERDSVTVDEVLGDLRAESSVGTLTTPQQVAWAVTMLLDPEADAMTGSTLMLDAGRRRGLP